MSSLCHVCDSVQVSRGSWFVKSPQTHRFRVTQETCSKLRRRSCAMSTGRETFTSTPVTSSASTKMVSSTFRTESETRSGLRVSCFLPSFDRSAESLNSLTNFCRWKGENVATAEVADVLTMSDCIEEANVYGVEVPGN